MRLFFLPWLSLISLRYVICYNRKVIDINENLFNLPVLLSWMHHLSVNHSEDSIIYGKVIKEQLKRFHLNEYRGMEKDLSKLIFRINDLSTLLIDNTEWQNAEYIVGKRVPTLMLCLVSLKITLGDLRNEIIKWENQNNIGQGIIKVKENVPFQWFNDHGFTDITLKDAKIKDLKDLVEGMYRDDLFSKKFLEFCGTILFYEPGNMTSTHLSFIATLVCSPKLVALVEKHLRSFKEELVPMANKLIESIHILAAEGSPLCKSISSSSRDEGLYTFAMEAYKHFVFEVGEIPNYLEVLQRVTLSSIIGIPYLKHAVSYDNTDDFSDVKKRGYYLNENTVNIPDLLSRLNILGNNDGPIAKLGKALRECNHAILMYRISHGSKYTTNRKFQGHRYQCSDTPQEGSNINIKGTSIEERSSYPLNHGNNIRCTRASKRNSYETIHLSLGIVSIAYVLCLM